MSQVEHIRCLVKPATLYHAQGLLAESKGKHEEILSFLGSHQQLQNLEKLAGAVRDVSATLTGTSPKSEAPLPHRICPTASKPDQETLHLRQNQGSGCRGRGSVPLIMRTSILLSFSFIYIIILSKARLSQMVRTYCNTSAECL